MHSQIDLYTDSVYSNAANDYKPMTEHTASYIIYAKQKQLGAVKKGRCQVK